MITVKRLREVLAKFPDDAQCYAYEGEVRGIVISPKGGWGGSGLIHCDERPEEETEVEYFPPIKDSQS
jgi:hypothetical protein